MTDKRPRRNFSPQFKADVVDAFNRGEGTFSELARKFDVGVTAVRMWVKNADQGPSDPQWTSELLGAVTVDVQEPEKPETPEPTKDPIAWVAYYPDWTGFVLFREELDALRYAVANQMQVILLHNGEDPREAVKG